MSEFDPYTPPQFQAEPSVNYGNSQQGLKSLLFGFEGRIPRRVFWIVTLAMNGILMLVYLALLLPAIALGEDGQVLIIVAALIILILAIPATWIGLAVQIKRWHDRDKSGWWVLIGFIPYIGGFWVLIECGCLRGTVGPNQYGPDPT